MCSCSIGSGAPSCRLMWTVRATSSHITAALTAASGVAPMVNTPWLRISTADERLPAQRLDDAAADRVVADDRERSDGDVAAELVGTHRQTHGTASPRAAQAVAYVEWVCTTPPTPGISR